MVKINDLLKSSNINIDDSILIVCKLLNVDKSYVFTYGDSKVSDSVGKDFLNLSRKRELGYPMQYILGTKEFMGIDFYVEEGVLIPRNDTETIVEYIIQYIRDNYKNEYVKLLDIGVGSGAISLSIAYYCKNAFVYGVDISNKALGIAEKNKKIQGIQNVEFMQGDLFNTLKDKDLKEQLHIIVSNPPYIESEIIETLDKEVKDFEPRLALDGGADGLDFYRRITLDSREFLKPKGLLIYEIGYNQGNSVKDILENASFKDVAILKDLSGNDRVVLGFK